MPFSDNQRANLISRECALSRVCAVAKFASQVEILGGYNAMYNIIYTNDPSQGGMDAQP